MGSFSAGQALTLRLRMLGTAHAVTFASYDVSDAERIGSGAYRDAVAVIGPMGNRMVVNALDLWLPDAAPALAPPKQEELAL